MDSQTNNGQAAAIGSLPFAEAVRAGNLLFISGQIGVGATSGQPGAGDLSDEVREVMKNIGGVLQRQGLDYQHLVNVSIYLTDMADYAVTNKVYSEFFQESFPSRVCIAVKELPLKARIEISAIALIP